jgi:transposase-like protein
MEQRETMRLHIAACKASGQTVAAYCGSHQLKPHQYYYWQKRVQLEQAPGKFLSITPLVTNAPILLTLVNGNRISFETLPPLAYLQQLLK